MDSQAPAIVDRREEQRRATRERLLGVSVAEFRQRGYARTDIAAIVERAEVARGTFYFHFPTKDDVLAELRLREERRIAGDIGPLVEAGVSLQTVLRAVVAGIVEAENRLGVDLVREICAVQFRPSVADSDDVSKHPLAEAVLAAVTQASRLPVIEEASDVAVIFLIGVFGLLSSYRGPSPERAQLLDSLIALTVKGAAAS